MRLSQNSIFWVGGHDFSKSYEAILFKFCTHLWNNIIQSLNEGFFFYYDKIFRANTWRKFDQKMCFFAQSIKNSNFNFFFLRPITRFIHVLTKYFWFFDFRWNNNELCWPRKEHFFWDVKGDDVPTAEFTEFLNNNFTKYCLNMFLWYAELFK